MEYLCIALAVITFVLFISLLGVSFSLIRKNTKHKATAKRLSDLEFKFKENPSYETQMLLADLLRGDAMFMISRISPEDIFIRKS